jgi:hypothetical protein
LDVVLARIRDRQALERENRQLAKQMGGRDAAGSASLMAKLDAIEGKIDRIEAMLRGLNIPRRRATD